MVAWTALRAAVSADDLASSGQVIRKGNLLPAIPTQSAFAQIAWRRGLKGFSANLDLQGRSRMFADDTNLASAAGYAVFNMALNYGRAFSVATINMELDGFARLENMFDRQIIGSVIVNDANQRYFEPSPGRRAMVGLRASMKF